MAPKETVEDEHPTLRKSLNKYFTSGKFSDMKIKCGETVHAVHRAIVCGQSSFFENAMNEEHNFKEAQTNTIELDHDHPTTIKAVLEYLYLENYGDLGLGDKFDNRITLHIDVYATADKYGIGGLMKYSADQIEKILDDEDWTVVVKSLALLVGAAWEKTPVNDRILRPLMVRKVSGEIEELIRETEFLTITEDVEGFNAALVKSMVVENKNLKNKAEGLVRYICLGCDDKVSLMLDDGSDYWNTTPWDAVNDNAVAETYCPACGDLFSNVEWKRHKV